MIAREKKRRRTNSLRENMWPQFGDDYPVGAAKQQPLGVFCDTSCLECARGSATPHSHKFNGGQHPAKLCGRHLLHCLQLLFYLFSPSRERCPLHDSCPESPMSGPGQLHSALYVLIKAQAEPGASSHLPACISRSFSSNSVPGIITSTSTADATIIVTAIAQDISHHSSHA